MRVDSKQPSEDATARMNIPAYLRRIGFKDSTLPDAETLRKLQWSHLLTVPFENLDIHLGRSIVLDLDRIFEKVVSHRRGGFCYELNGLFAWLLTGLGYQVSLLSASDAHDDGRWGPEYDHLVLLVHCPGVEGESWLVDVGWGDTFREPLRLDTPSDQLQHQGTRAYRLQAVSDHRLLCQQDAAGKWERQYGFILQARNYADFAGMCQYHQTSPESFFTRKRLCTLALPTGRITLDNMRLITTENGERHERPVLDDIEYRRILSDRFGIDLAGDPWVATSLMISAG
jgi:N-hydroxyarylamine O-acetyltransferase